MNQGERLRSAQLAGAGERLPLIVPGPGGCWLWTGTPNSKGYGRWWVRGPDRGRLAHVVVWETFNGPTPEGMQHDHLCRVKPCVNEAHLELVTGRVNLHRRNLANGWGRAENRVPDQAF